MLQKEIASSLPKRPIDSHKGDFGHVFVLAGSEGMTGAAYLTSQAALVSGSGLVTLGIPRSLNTIMEIKMTEVMTLPLAETSGRSFGKAAGAAILRFIEKCDVAAIGPGISRRQETQALVRSLLKKIEKPVVLDADGLTSIAGGADVIMKRKAATVITPHPGEMARLIGRDTAHVQKNRERVAKSVSVQYNCVTILKGYRTIVAAPDGQVYVNESGNSGMSTAGMGDILTGMVASLIGQGIGPYSASVVSVYLHGKAGDIAAQEIGQFGMVAGDVLARLPQAFKASI